MLPNAIKEMLAMLPNAINELLAAAIQGYTEISKGYKSDKLTSR
jgi:hypothetical protein